MTWCEEKGVDYVFGFAGNSRVVKKIAKQLKKRFWKTGRAVRYYRDFRYRTLNS